jgi:hypothetical protein
MKKVREIKMIFVLAFIAMTMVFIGCKEESSPKGKVSYKKKVSYINNAFYGWSQALQAYIKKNNTIGDCKAIGYILPEAEDSSNYSQTEDFSFICGAKKSEAFLYARSRDDIGDYCHMGNIFKIEFNTEEGAFNVHIPSGCTLFEEVANNLNKTFFDLKYEGVKPKTAWEYKESEDKMDNSKSYFATVTSTNEINFSFPYDGGSSFDLTVRNKKKQNEVILIVSKGQFSGSSKTCRVKYDDESVVNYDYEGTSDYNSNVIFFNNPKKFITSLKKAKKLMIECPFFQEGRKVIEFDDVQGLEWNR